MKMAVMNSLNLKLAYIRMLLSACLLLSALPLMAESDSAAHEQLLKKFMPNTCLFTGSFTQKKVNPQFSLQTTGRLLYGCDYGLVWQSEKPFLETTLYKHDKQFWLVSADGDKELLTSVAQKGLADFLLKLMAADTDYFIDAFNVAVDGDVLVLSPKSKMMRKVLDNIKVGGATTDEEQAQFQVITMTMSMTSGEKNIVTIDNLKSSAQQTKEDQIDACVNMFETEQQTICKLLKRKNVNVYKR